MRRPCCSQWDMMPHVPTASVSWTLPCSGTEWEWSRSSTVCSTVLSPQREKQQQPVTSSSFPTPHPSDLVIPSALPASSLHINLPSSFDSSPASLCSLSFKRVLSAEREQSKEQLSRIMWGKQVRSHLILLSCGSVLSFLHGKGNIISLCSVVVSMFLNRLFWIIAAIKCYAQLCAACFCSSKPCK